VFEMHVSSVSSILRRMLQVLYLNVSKVDRVLHLASSSPPATSPWCLHLLSMLPGHPNERCRRAPSPSLLLNAGGASWDGGTTWDGGAAGDRPPRVHEGCVLLLFHYMGRDRCARFFCYSLRSDGSCSLNRIAPSCVRTRHRAGCSGASRPVLENVRKIGSNSSFVIMLL
jgi:hypothetical protein